MSRKGEKKRAKGSKGKSGYGCNLVNEVKDDNDVEWNGHDVVKLLQKLSLEKCLEYLMNGYIKKNATTQQYHIYPLTLQKLSIDYLRNLFYKFNFSLADKTRIKLINDHFVEMITTKNKMHINLLINIPIPTNDNSLKFKINIKIQRNNNDKYTKKSTDIPPEEDSINIMPEDSEVIARLINIAKSNQTIESAIRDLGNQLPFEDETNVQVAQTMMNHVNDTVNEYNFIGIVPNNFRYLKLKKKTIKHNNVYGILSCIVFPPAIWNSNFFYINQDEPKYGTRGLGSYFNQEDDEQIISMEYNGKLRQLKFTNYVTGQLIFDMKLKQTHDCVDSNIQYWYPAICFNDKIKSVQIL